jgi:hypothetical protein
MSSGLSVGLGDRKPAPSPCARFSASHPPSTCASGSDPNTRARVTALRRERQPTTGTRALGMVNAAQTLAQQRPALVAAHVVPNSPIWSLQDDHRALSPASECAHGSVTTRRKPFCELRPSRGWVAGVAAAVRRGGGVMRASMQLARQRRWPVGVESAGETTADGTEARGARAGARDATSATTCSRKRRGCRGRRGRGRTPGRAEARRARTASISASGSVAGLFGHVARDLSAGSVGPTQRALARSMTKRHHEG